MDAGAVISTVAAVLALGVAFFTAWFNRGKTKAQQDAISTKASNDTLELVQASLHREVDRLRKDVTFLHRDLDTVRTDLSAMTGERDELKRQNGHLRDEVEGLRRRVAELEKQ